MKTVHAPTKPKKRATQSRHGRRKDNLQYRWSIFNAQARRRSIPVSITKLEYLAITSQQCHYCGGIEGASVFNGNDRVNSNDTYSLQNSVPCCQTCNFMKGSMQKQKFLQHIHTIQLHTQRRIQQDLEFRLLIKDNNYS